MVDFKLYLITDRKLVAPRPRSAKRGGRHSSLVTAVEEALKGGVKALQLREKDLGTRELLDMAYRMRELTAKYGAKLFINDRVDIALSVEADGVHLGQKSIPAYAVRKIVKDKFMIGVSAHSIEEAKQAEKEGADFITLGPVYQTPSKLRYGQPLGVDIIRKTKAEISIPVFAIGGVKQFRVKEVINAGADGIALISGILGARNIRDKTEEVLGLLSSKVILK